MDIGVGEDGDDAARASLCTQPESAARAAAEKHTVTANNTAGITITLKDDANEMQTFHGTAQADEQ